LAEDSTYRDRELFKRITNGDQAAFSVIFQTYSAPLYYHAFKLLNSEFWAEELVQEVFVQLWFKRHLLADIDVPSSYLYRMVGNKALDRMRRQELEMKMQYFVAQALHDGGEVAAQSDRWDKIEVLLQAAVNSLPEKCKRVYQLKYQQDCSYEEIAEQLSITKHTVRNQMAKALQSIRSFLMEKGDWLILLLCSILLIS
jgi:RNA polymerase sigma-70 factor (ECF subfamily)